MKRKYVIPIIFLVIAVIIAATVFLILQPSLLDLHFHGMLVSEDGSVLEAGAISLSGIRFKDGNFHRLKFKELILPNTDLTLPSTSGFITYPLTDSYEFCYGAFINNDIGRNGVWERFELYLSTDSDWFIMTTDRNRLFVGSTDEDFDPSQILAKVAEHLE